MVNYKQILMLEDQNISFIQIITINKTDARQPPNAIFKLTDSLSHNNRRGEELLENHRLRS